MAGRFRLAYREIPMAGRLSSHGSGSNGKSRENLFCVTNRRSSEREPHGRCLWPPESCQATLSDSSPPGFDLVVHAEVRRASAGGSAASVTSTWIAWHRRNEVTTFCERLCPSMTKGKNEKNRKQNADRRNAVICRAEIGLGGAWVARRTSIGVPPRLSPRGA